MTDLRQWILDEMQLRGLSPGTQRPYLRAARELGRYYGRSPETLTAAVDEALSGTWPVSYYRRPQPSLVTSALRTRSIAGSAGHLHWNG